MWVVSPIILSGERAQSKQAQRAGRFMPGKGRAINRSGAGRPNPCQKANHSKQPGFFSTTPPSCEPQFPALSQDKVHWPQAAALPTVIQPSSPRTPPEAHTASFTETSLEAQSLLSEPSLQGSPHKTSRFQDWLLGGRRPQAGRVQ